MPTKIDVQINFCVECSLKRLPFENKSCGDNSGILWLKSFQGREFTQIWFWYLIYDMMWCLFSLQNTVAHVLDDQSNVKLIWCIAHISHYRGSVLFSKYTNQNNKYVNQNTKYGKQNIKYAN